MEVLQRPEMVDMAGGRSQVAQLTTAAIILLVLLFLTRPVSFMPAVVLSAVVFLIGARLIDVSGFREVYRSRRDEFWIAAITAATVAFVGVEPSILMAIAISVIDHLRVSSPPTSQNLTARICRRGTSCQRRDGVPRHDDLSVQRVSLLRELGFLHARGSPASQEYEVAS